MWGRLRVSQSATTFLKASVFLSGKHEVHR
jgi:hypothetical protein